MSERLYTVKKFTSKKAYAKDGSWEHEEISLLLPDAKEIISKFLSSRIEAQHSLAPNPDAYYESIRKALDEDRYLEKLGLTKGDFTVAWHYWQLDKHSGEKHIVDFKTLLDKSSVVQSGEELLLH